MSPPGTGPPEHLPPMLATTGEVPGDAERYAFELKWDGIRAVCHWDGDRLRFESRNLRDITPAYPELAALGPALGSAPLVLDGEIVALDDRGVPSFQRLQERMHTRDPLVARDRAARVPVTYLAFDVLHTADGSLLDRPWTERRARLDGLRLAGPSWATSPAFVGEGQATLEAARSRGLEGIVAKRLDSTYVPGRRSPAWIKHKLISRDDFVVGGWLPGKGGRSGQIGALLLGEPLADHPDGGPGDGPPDRLRFVGGVGTGFTAAELARLLDRLSPTATDESPFVGTQPARRDAVFVRPELVVEVTFTERTDAKILRHPSYQGVRIDKSAPDMDTDAG